MKRTVVGIFGLLSLMGAGSAGLYFGHDYFLADSDAATVDAADFAPRDLTPTPIPLAGSAPADPAPAANPFRQTSKAERVEQRQDGRGGWETTDDRYGNDVAQARYPESQEESVPATRSADPLGLRDRTATNRYAERQVAAEVEADEPADDSQDPQESAAAEVEDEPRPLPGLPVAEQSESDDRYARPSAPTRPVAINRPTEHEPVEDAPREAPQRFEEPASRPAPIVEPQERQSIAGTGKPGDPQLSGSQAPTLTIEKMAPPEIQIGKPAKFLIKVRNAGSVAAQGVEIHDTIPQGTELIETIPNAERGPQGGLVWELGALKPGDERTVEVQLMPTAEGEIGSVATVHFRALASVRTVATKPMLSMELSGPAKVMKGQPVALKIKLSNPGTGAATGIVLSDNVPDGLSHEGGKELEFDVGTLKPGETRELELTLMTTAAGAVSNVITAQGEGNLQAEATSELEVVAPQLQIGMSGPKRRYLERNATHTISISNPGTATAKDIELVAVLPRELKFIEANNGGQFDAATHSVYWGLEELPPQETGTVTLTTLPLEAGEAKLLLKAAAQQGLKDERAEVVMIEGLAAVNFQLSDTTGPIEVGGQASYEIRLTNQGSKGATGVRVVALLPREIKPVSAEGPSRYKIEGQRVIFEPLKQLAAKGEATFTIKAQALAPGDLRVQVQLATDELREPITKEESTRIFGNE